MAAVYKDAIQAGEESLLPYKKNANLPMFMEIGVNKLYFIRKINLLEVTEGLVEVYTGALLDNQCYIEANHR